MLQKAIVLFAEQRVLLGDTVEVALSPRRVCRPMYMQAPKWGENYLRLRLYAQTRHSVVNQGWRVHAMMRQSFVSCWFAMISAPFLRGEE